MTEQTLLWPHRTKYETAISEAVADWWKIPVDVLATIWDPRTCPENVLPYIAWALSVDLWSDKWSISKKRSVVARAPALSRIRGTEPAFSEFLDIVDGKLVEFIAPPQGLFPKSQWTPERLREWREQFPEIRVYPFRNRHQAPRNLMVIGEPWFGRRSILRKSIAAEYGGRRATCVKDGVETPISIRVDVGAGEFARGFFTVALPTRLPRVSFPAVINKRFLFRGSTANKRVYVYAEGGRSPDLLPPGVPIALKPDRVAAKHVKRGGFIVGRTLPMVLRANNAMQFVYDSVRIYDPERAVKFGPPRKGGWILGRSKFRQAPFLLRITADLSRKRKGGFVIGSSFPAILRKFDASRLEEGFAAVRAAKIGRDRVMVRTNLHRQLAPSENIRPDGSYRVGQSIKYL